MRIRVAGHRLRSSIRFIDSIHPCFVPTRSHIVPLKRPHIFRLAALLATVTVGSAQSATADSWIGVGEGSDRWTPSLALDVGISTNSIQGDSSSVELPLPSTGEAPRPAVDNEKVALNPRFSGQLELRSPSLPIPLRPSFFFAGEVATVSSQERSVARENDPGPLIDPNPDSPALPNPDSVLGQGSNLSAGYRNYALGAIAGIAFPVRVNETQIWIKPSARYINQEVETEGAIVNVFGPNAVGATAVRSVELFGEEKFDVHGVGPFLEIEAEVGKIGGIDASLFINGGSYRIVSDTSVRFQTTRADSDGTETYQATWETEIEEWLHRASFGLRLAWGGAPAGWLGQR